MLNVLTQGYMLRAFFVAAIIALIAPLMGTTIVLKRLSAIGDATSHSALGGIAFGLMIGINPILGAILFSLFAVIGIEGLRRAFGEYSEIATVVVMSAGIGLTAVLSRFIQSGGGNLENYMFGSIMAISDFEVWLTVILGAAVILVTSIFHKELFYITFDEEAAKLAGVKTGLINFIIMLMTAVTVSLASRIVGALMISSLLVIPVATAMMVARSYKQTIIWSIIFAEAFTVGGLLLSYRLSPGGTIVLTGVAVLIITAVITRKRRM